MIGQVGFCSKERIESAGKRELSFSAPAICPVKIDTLCDLAQHSHCFASRSFEGYKINPPDRGPNCTSIDCALNEVGFRSSTNSHSETRQLGVADKYLARFGKGQLAYDGFGKMQRGHVASFHTKAGYVEGD
jgi:hypothetical protein